MTTMGDAIKHARKRAGMTQKELAKKIGKGFSTVQKYEMDIILPPPDTIIKLAEVLNIPVAELMGQKISAPEFLILPILEKSGYQLEKVDDIDGGYSNLYIKDIETGKRCEVSEEFIEELQNRVISYTRFEVREYLKKKL